MGAGKWILIGGGGLLIAATIFGITMVLGAPTIEGQNGTAGTMTEAEAKNLIEQWTKSLKEYAAKWQEGG
jgi:hypothetical protein